MKIKTVVMTAGATLLAISFSGTALAADGATLYKEKGCVACHGEDAKTTLMPNFPKLAGQNAAYLYAQMIDIKTGKRANGLSAAMAKPIEAVSDEDLKAIGDWLATL